MSDKAARDFAKKLQDAMEAVGVADASDVGEMLEEILMDRDGVQRTQSYEDGGWLTSDDGFVLEMGDGSEFHITVKQANPSRDGSDDEDVEEDDDASLERKPGDDPEDDALQTEEERKREHRFQFPGQYHHPLVGHFVEHIREGKLVFGIVDRVVQSSRYGELAHFDLGNEMTSDHVKRENAMRLTAWAVSELRIRP